MLEIKQLAIDTIEKHAQEIIGFGDKILNCPELGFKEYKTSQFIKEEFEKLGIHYQESIGITGLKATATGRSNKLNICIIGEMDAVKSSLHPNANGETSAAHACGHNVQIAQLMGSAIGLVKSEVIKELDGTVTFFAVPAEEFIELDYRLGLRQEGFIQYFSGKQELIMKDYFDDIDIAIMIHAEAKTPEAKIFTRGSSLGFVAKEVKFIGKEAHGSRPFEGVNALNAAMLAISGIHANRETFREEDKVRIHPIITKGGDLVNTVPADVRLETYIRGANKQAIEDATVKVERSIHGAALMIGARAEIETIQGYLPLIQDQLLSDVFEDNAKLLFPKNHIIQGVDMVGSSDIGDLSHILPCIQPTMGGFTGEIHGKDFAIADKQLVYIEGSKLLVMTVIDLLIDQGKKAQHIKENFKAKLTKDEYKDYLKRRA